PGSTESRPTKSESPLFQKCGDGGIELRRLFPPSSGRRGLRQLDRLERANDVVRTFVLKEALVETRAEIPVIALVVFVSIKSPDATHDDERADPIVPKIAEEIPTEIRAGTRSFEANVIINDHLR